MKTSDLNGVLKDAENLLTRTDNLFNNIKRKRVTHTGKSITNVARALTKVQNGTQNPTQFLRALSFALYQSQSGPTEIKLQPKRQVFIQGTFDLEELRTYLLVSNPIDTILLEVAEPGK